MVIVANFCYCATSVQLRLITKGDVGNLPHENDEIEIFKSTTDGEEGGVKKFE